MNETHVAVIADDPLAGELIRRGVPGFQIRPIEGRELMAHRALGLPVVTNFVGTAAESVARYRLCNIVLSPSSSADRALMSAGVRARRICRWDPAVDHSEFSPARYSAAAFAEAGDPSRITLLYVGLQRPSAEVDLLLAAFFAAQRQDPRLHIFTSASAETDPAVYASADLLLCPGASDLCGDVLLKAQASGLPILAVQEGVAEDLIESGRSGCLVQASPFAFSEAIRWLARRATLRERLATGGLQAAAERTWENSLSHLADSWRVTLSSRHETAIRAA